MFVAALERAAVRVDRLIVSKTADVDLLQRARQDARAEVGLVGVDADAPDVLLLRRVEGAEAAAAGDLEDDVGALGDLVQRDLLALRLVGEVTASSRSSTLIARVGRLGASLVAGDVAVDRRDLLAADAELDCALRLAGAAILPSPSAAAR